MKIYSLLKFLKKSCFIGSFLFFFNFAWCTFFMVEFDTMFWFTFPAIVYVFVSYSLYCIVESFKEENILPKNRRKIINIDNYRYCKKNVSFSDFEELGNSSVS